MSNTTTTTIAVIASLLADIDCVKDVYEYHTNLTWTKGSASLTVQVSNQPMALTAHVYKWEGHTCVWHSSWMEEENGQWAERSIATMHEDLMEMLRELYAQTPEYSFVDEDGFMIARICDEEEDGWWNCYQYDLLGSMYIKHQGWGRTAAMSWLHGHSVAYKGSIR